MEESRSDASGRRGERPFTMMRAFEQRGKRVIIGRRGETLSHDGVGRWQEILLREGGGNR